MTDQRESMSRPNVRTAARIRSGQRFQPVAERRLEAVARRMLHTLPLGTGPVLAFKEFHAPNGVPDITVVAPDPRRHERLGLDVPPILNPIDAAIVQAATAQVGKTASELTQKLGWKGSTVDRRLPQLLRLGALRETTADRFVRPAALVPVGRLYAIELKIDDWRRALRQCRNYRLWAEGYLLILETVPDRSRDILRREVLNDRGGLVVGGEMLVAPRISQQPGAVRMLSSEHMVAELWARSNPRPRHTR
jgi:hypothetical protein